MKAITIAGRVTRDATLRRTQSGDPVLGFSVAVDDGFGQNKRALFFDCSVWGKRGETLKDMLPKGKEVTVSGDLSTREHDGKTYLTVRVNELTLQGGRSSEGASSRQDQGMYDREPAGGGYGGGNDLDSEIPFAPEWR